MKPSEHFKANADAIMVKVTNSFVKSIDHVETEIREATPIDSGKMRRRWYRDIISQNVVRIVNNVKYARTIEYGLYEFNTPITERTIYGFSKQAPMGILRVNADEYRQLIINHVKEEMGL